MSPFLTMLLDNIVTLYPDIKNRKLDFANEVFLKITTDMSLGNLERNEEVRRLSNRIANLIDREYQLSELAESHGRSTNFSVPGFGVPDKSQLQLLNLYGKLLVHWGIRNEYVSQDFRKKFMLAYLVLARPFLRGEVLVPEEYREGRNTVDPHSPLSVALSQTGNRLRQPHDKDIISYWRLVTKEVFDSASIYQFRVQNPGPRKEITGLDGAWAGTRTVDQNKRYRQPENSGSLGLLQALEHIHSYGIVLSSVVPDFADDAATAWPIIENWYLSLVEKGQKREVIYSLGGYLTSRDGMALMQPHHRAAIESMAKLLGKIEKLDPSLFADLAQDLARFAGPWRPQNFRDTATGQAMMKEFPVIRDAIANRPEPPLQEIGFGYDGPDLR